MEAIGIGDLHLTSHNGNGALSKYCKDSDEVILKQASLAVEYGLRQGIRNIFLYGDVCDGPKMSYRAHQALFNFFKQYSLCDFYIITGNHDIVSVGGTHSLELLETFNAALPNVYIFRKPTMVEIDGVTVNFLPYPFKDFKYIALNVCHLEVSGCSLDSGRISKSDIDTGECITVAGHIHTHGKVANCYYSGSPVQTNFGEKLDKGFHHIRFNSRNDYSIDFISQEPSIKLKTLVINTKQDCNVTQERGDVYRLLIQDGADVQPQDYMHLNVAQVKSFKTNEDLQSIATAIDYVSIEDIKPEDVLNELLDAQTNLCDEMRERIREVRRRVLSK